MAILNLNDLVRAMASPASRIVLDKASLANQLAGRMCSLWRATGQPAQGAIPAAAALCTNATLGAIQFTQQVAPSESYIGVVALTAGNSAMSWEIHDRIAASGGGNLTLTTAQTNIACDLLALAAPAARIGDANFGDVQCWLEVYADGGATASNATINVTFDNGTTGVLSTLAVGGTIRIGNMFSLNALRTPAQQGLYIRAVNSVTLSATTGAAGNFGITFTRPRAYIPTPLANLTESYDWAALGLPGVPNGACLQFMVIPSITSSGTLRGGGKIIHG